MSYWMFNPCSPCCSSIVPCIGLSGCQVPTGTMNYIIYDDAKILKRYQAEPSGDSWQFNIPLSDFYDTYYSNQNAILAHDIASGTWLPHYTSRCNSGQSATMRVTLRNLNSGTQLFTGTSCGPYMVATQEFLNDGPCYSGKFTCYEGANKNSVRNHYVYYATGTFIPINADTSGIPYTLYHPCNTGHGSPTCFNNCPEGSFGTRYNCQYGNYHYNFSPTNNQTNDIPFNYCSGQTAATAFDLSSFNFNGFFTDTLNYKLQDSSYDLREIPSGLYLQVKAFPYSGTCNYAYCYDANGNGWVKTGIEIDSTIQLTFNTGEGYWHGTNLPYNLHSRICNDSNPSGWYTALYFKNVDGLSYPTGCGTDCNFLGTGSFNDVYFYPTTLYHGTGTTCTNYKSQVFNLIARNQQLTIKIDNIIPQNILLSPFYFDFRRTGAITTALGLLGSTKWTDERTSIYDNGFGNFEDLDPYYPYLRTLRNIRESLDGNHGKSFSYVGSFGSNETDESSILASTTPFWDTVNRMFGCHLGSGYIVISE